MKELLSKMPGKPRFKELLETMIEKFQVEKDEEKRRALAAELGLGTPPAPKTPPTEGPK
jgi:hypothetical protein